MCTSLSWSSVRYMPPVVLSAVHASLCVYYGGYTQGVREGVCNGGYTQGGEKRRQRGAFYRSLPVLIREAQRGAFYRSPPVLERRTQRCASYLPSLIRRTQRCASYLPPLGQTGITRRVLPPTLGQTGTTRRVLSSVMLIVCTTVTIRTSQECQKETGLHAHVPLLRAICAVLPGGYPIVHPVLTRRAE